jgi:RNA polymerase sigma-70 factor (ECF subfamily)
MATDTLGGRAYAPAIEEPAAAPAAAAVPSPMPGTVPASAGIAEVYAAHGDYLFRCLRSLGVRADLLDDSFQDVFLVVQDKLASFDGRAKLQTWLYAIVLRVARRYRERAAREASRFVADEPASTRKPEDELVQNEQLALARRALGALDDPKREVFVLALIEQMSAPEIAAVLDVPLNTVYSRLRAARAAFSAEVARLQQKSRRSP